MSGDRTMRGDSWPGQPLSDDTGDQRVLTATSTQKTCPAAPATAGVGGGGVPAPSCTDLDYLTPANRVKSVLITAVSTHQQEQERMRQTQ